MKISRIFTEYQEQPLGLDVESPRFSWLLEAEEKSVMQTAYRVCVRTRENEMWDSGRVNSADSQGIEYAGESLKPCTEYTVDVTVWDNHGYVTSGSACFETGLLNPSIDAWEGAKWIGATRYTVCAANRGVYVLETSFRIEGGRGRAGIVFGANDESLTDHNKIGRAHV